MSIRILHGDCRELLRTLPDQSVHCCVLIELNPEYAAMAEKRLSDDAGLFASVELTDTAACQEAAGPAG